MRLRSMKNKKAFEVLMKKFLFFTLSIFICYLSIAQDPHFSQYQSAPLLFNPALTGVMKSDFKMSANFRTQYWTAGNNFITNAISYEQKYTNSSLQEAVNKFSWGIGALYDVSAGGVYKNSNFLLSGAYTKPLNFEGTSNLSIGLQGIVSSRVISKNNLSFSNQFNGDYFDLTLPNNENIGSYRKTFGSIGIGLVYSIENESDLFTIGSSLYHFNRPRINFEQDKQYRLPIRQVLHSSYRTRIGQMQNYAMLNFGYMRQGGAQNLMFGGAFGLVKPSENDYQTALTAGFWYRYRDAIVPYIGMDWNKFQLGISYDIIGKELRSITPKNASFEISIRYSGQRKGNAFIQNIVGREF